MNIFGMEVITQEGQLPEAIKFVHPNGNEQVFINSNEVIEEEEL